MSEAGLSGPAVVSYGTDVQARFMVRVYGHLLGAVAAFVMLEVALFTSGAAEAITRFVASTSWLLILGAFVIVSWLATSVAVRARSAPAQYGAFTALIGAEALLFVPLLWIANQQAEGVVARAGWLSVGGFVALSGIALTARTDFSFLGTLLRWVGVVALLAIVGAVLFGVALGTWFSVAMIAFAGAAILYDTQQILRRYPPDREVAAAMSLFASLALLFWYVLRLLSRD